MKGVRVSLENFDEKLNESVATGNPVFVLFFGTEVPETSESWCPDCVIADPLIRKAISPIENAILLEAPVGARNEWKGNTTHPYRVRFGLSAIPTLFKWTKEGPGARLVEEDCADIEKLNEFVRN
ncbi:DUF953-domain-containing protein [Rhizopus microsporus var. microsporus]|uniref:DUF953-domain-containing protein n=2 Tax=Rhizopus microsporus TaxID=58291 RepID=A0A2G4T5B0_RHIZD|nr:DUF953-domain-containing protein [Rhizopus microsporus ATCC 52813]ORE04926.1 DUF953-domain-containing protein [Rhizopus microsporus var. microsporus]PHZ16188.1 DUF953-domain-containing protein [Rhizopus microsporus ATCC 52813]